MIGDINGRFGSRFLPRKSGIYSSVGVPLPRLIFFSTSPAGGLSGAGGAGERSEAKCRRLSHLQIVSLAVRKPAKLRLMAHPHARLRMNRPVSVEHSAINTYIVCMWKFSKHALLRIEERGYTQRGILSILNVEVPSIVIASPQEETVDLYFSRIDLKYLLVVVDKQSHTIITVRPLRKKEKQAFIEEVENE